MVTGECLYCGCPKLTPHPDADLLERLQPYLLPQLSEDTEKAEQYTPEEYSHTVSVETVEMIAHDYGPKIVYEAVVFMGRASRSCKQCGEIKLYKEFNGSNNPERLCRLCEDWKEQEDVLNMLTEAELEEIEALEEDILEAEDEYQDIWERQHIIDEVLRELDE